MMHPSLTSQGRTALIIFCFCVYGIKSQAGCPDIGLPARLDVKENAPAGTVLFRSNTTIEETDSQWTLVETSSFFSLNFMNLTYELVTLIALNLDTQPNCVLSITQTLDLQCSPIATQQQVIIDIEPVNESPPIFDTSMTSNIIVYENVSIGYKVLSILDAIRDADCYSIYTVQLLPYPTNEFDGRTLFGLNNTGEYLYLKQEFDVEELRCQFSVLDRYIRVNVTDGAGTDHVSSASTDVKIELVSVDDEPPVFTNDVVACEDRRIQLYTASIGFDDEGLVSVSPSHINAIDPDTIDPVIVYEIIDANPPRYADNVDIDPQNGNVTLVTSFSNLTASLNETVTEDFTITFTLRARENKTDQISSNTTFMLTVTLPETTTMTTTTIEQTTTDEQGTTAPPPTTKQTTVSTTPSTPRPTQTTPVAPKATDATSNNLKDREILIIVLPIVGGILLIFVITIACMKYRISKGRKEKLAVEKNMNDMYGEYKHSSMNGDQANINNETNNSKEMSMDNPIFDKEDAPKNEDL